MDEAGNTQAPPMRLSGAGVAEGARRILPVSVFVVPFGVAFGAAAIDRGLTPAEAIAMSATVFAGASQFAAIDLWGSPMPFLSVALVVLAVNARHLILGAALSPWLNPVPPRRRFLALAFLTDANFADSRAAFANGARDAGILLGGGIVLWATWLVGTATGALLGNAIGALDRWGIDVVMVAFFAALVVGGLSSRAQVPPVAIAVVVAVATLDVLPTGWNVVVAALAGGLAGGLGGVRRG